MKFIALAATLSTASAALGDDCFYDETICAPDGLECPKWEDSQYGPMASCEDCNKSDKTIADSFGDDVTYECPNKGGGGSTAPPAAGPAGEEGSSYIAVSALAAIAVSMIAA